MDRENIPRHTIQGHINLRMRADAETRGAEYADGIPLPGFSIYDRTEAEGLNRFYHRRLIIFHSRWETTPPWASNPYSRKIGNLTHRAEWKRDWIESIKKIRACEKPRLP